MSDSDDRPVIGITTYLERAQTGVWDVRASFLPEVYIDAVTRVDAIAVLLPPQPVSPRIARAVLAGIDGLVVAGGADIDPARYGQEPHPATTPPRGDRDAWEESLVAAAIEMDLPFLGICRGIQMINVALGGTLVQHLPDVVGSSAYQPSPAIFGEVDVCVASSSTIAALLGTGESTLPVRVYHHQAIDEVADGLVVTARSIDGVIEAVEMPGVRFGVGVQWHPEEDCEDHRIFAGLADAARAYREHRSFEK